MPPQKRLFVTIGATAPFNTLIRTVLSHSFLQALTTASYTELRLQHGSEGAHILSEVDLSNIHTHYGITVTGFDFNHTGLEDEMKALKSRDVAYEGAIVSHAGSGSVLEAMRYGVPCVVVPNGELLGNHQTELAEVLDKLGYVVYGRMEELAEAIPKVEALRLKMRQWPPPTSQEEKHQKGLKGVMDEEMGWATKVD